MRGGPFGRNLLEIHPFAAPAWTQRRIDYCAVACAVIVVAGLVAYASALLTLARGLM